jgi:uncharacterized protein (TIGR02452 family)
MDRRSANVLIWEETKSRYVSMKPQDSIVVDSFDRERYESTKRPYTTKLVWHPTDCVDVAVELKQKGFNPLLLNMASDFQPGGGVAKGTTAQEEELFRRSNYFKFLHRRWYPFPPLRTIVSKGVEFYRHSVADGYALMESPVLVDCVAVAGIRRPECSQDLRRFKHTSDANLLLAKLRLLFQVAAENGNDVLVLSALGCGAFGGPIPHIAALFRQVVDENAGRFREIHFAILGGTYITFRDAYERASP